MSHTAVKRSRRIAAVLQDPRFRESGAPRHPPFAPRRLGLSCGHVALDVMPVHADEDREDGLEIRS